MIETTTLVHCDTLHYQVTPVFVFIAGSFVNLLSVPSPEVIQQEGSTLSVMCQATSTDCSLEIQWHQITTEGVKLPVKNSSSSVQDLLFKIESAVLRTNILTVVTSTLTMECLSVAYAGAYTCSAVAGEFIVDSDAFQVLVSGMPASHEPSSDYHTFNHCSVTYVNTPLHNLGTTMNSTLPTTDNLDQDCFN